MPTGERRPWREDRHPRRGNGRFRGQVGHDGPRLTRAERLAARADTIATTAAGNVPDDAPGVSGRTERLAARAAAVAADGTTTSSEAGDATTR